MTARIPFLSAAMPTYRRALVGVAIALAAAIYFFTLHLLIAERSTPRLALALVLLPWVVAMLARRGWRVVGVCAAALAAATITRVPESIVAHVELLLLIENVAFLLALCTVFAASLAAGREPMITMLARAVRGGTIPVSVAVYTRRVTIAWALFFLACACTSIALYRFAPLAIWSLFVNVLIWPAMAAMFVVEYAIRLRALPDVEHTSFVDGIKAYAARKSVMRERDDRH